MQILKTRDRYLSLGGKWVAGIRNSLKFNGSSLQYIYFEYNDEEEYIIYIGNDAKEMLNLMIDKISDGENVFSFEKYNINPHLDLYYEYLKK